MNRHPKAVAVSILVACATLGGPATAQQQRLAQAAPPTPAAASSQAGSGDQPTEIGPTMNLSMGKSTLVRLPAAIDRISVGNPSVADVTLISARELYLLGKTFGSTNVIMWRRNGATTIIDVNVSLDAGALEARLRELMPNEKNIRVSTAADSVVLSGTVSSALQADFAVSVAEAFGRSFGSGIELPIVAGGGQAAPGQQLQVGQVRPTASARANQKGPLRVINMLQIGTAQQVMLEVKVAEISKTLLDKLGVGVNASRGNGDWRYGIISDFLSGSSGLLGAVKNPLNSIQLDAERRDGLVRVLAEPNIVAISGQEASFLSGGTIFIPVSRTDVGTGLPTITLEEKEFGVGLRFTPTVLEGDRINLRVTPEVSELNPRGSPFTQTNGITTIFPSFTTRRAQTTVQLTDGQSFAIAGLIKNNVTETISRFPILGDLPILGALFRSSEFQTDMTELMFIVTPRLVKPLPAAFATPTDNWVPPNRLEFFVNGQLEGSGHPDVPPATPQQRSPQTAGQPAAPASGGFQLK
jgi:pilus assembly protein CpaC